MFLHVELHFLRELRDVAAHVVELEVFAEAVIPANTPPSSELRGDRIGHFGCLAAIACGQGVILVEYHRLVNRLQLVQRFFQFGDIQRHFEHRRVAMRSVALGWR